MTFRYRNATEADIDLYYGWANDPEVRRQSFRPEPISHDTHCAWFRSRLGAAGVLMLVFEDVATGEPAGQVRIEAGPKFAVVGISVADSYRGRGLAALMLEQATREFHRRAAIPVRAFIRQDNAVSRRAFERAGYRFIGDEVVSGVPSLVFEHTSEDNHSFRPQ
jgi:RimJ/RimL family protein N-acetyltransferase